MAACAWDQFVTTNSRFSLIQMLIHTLYDLNGQPQTLAGNYGQIFDFAQHNQI